MGKASRASFGEALVELGEKYKNIVVLDADLAKSTKTDGFWKKYPDRFFDMGIAEANMVGTAAGLALSGKRAFCASFGCFLTGRYDIIRMSAGYTAAPMIIVGTHAGVATGEDGHSQMGLEDIALMRVIPNMKVIQPADDVETKAVMEYLASTDLDCPVYLRLTRQNLDDVHGKDYKYNPKKLDKLFSNSEEPEVVIVATGGLVGPSFEAAKVSNKKIAVYNCATIKPFDSETIAKLPKSVKKIIAAEDHSTVGGLGAVIAEVIAENGLGIKLVRHGVPDVFGESGTPEELYEKFGFTKDGVSKLI